MLSPPLLLLQLQLRLHMVLDCREFNAESLTLLAKLAPREMPVLQPGCRQHQRTEGNEEYVDGAAGE